MDKAKLDRVRQYLSGEIIFQEGQASEHFYILQKGEVEVSIKKNEKRFVINRLGPGEFFGEMGLLSNEPRSASCKAITFVEVAQINNEEFKKVVNHSHPLTGKIINVLLSRLKKSNSHSINNAVPTNSFFAVATLLDLNFKAANSDTILLSSFIKQITSTFGILPHQAKEILQHLCDLGLIRQEIKIRRKSEFSSFQDEGEGRIVLLSNNLLEGAKKIQEWPSSFSSELELMEIKEALDLYGIDQKKFYMKMTAADFPDHLFFINKPVLYDLVQNKGKNFFEKPSVKNIEDITGLEELIFVDKKTIQLALQEIEVYEVAKLIKSASADIADLLMGCFSARMKGIIEMTIGKISVDDDLDIQELESSFIGIIKRIKKPAS